MWDSYIKNPYAENLHFVIYARANSHQQQPLFAYGTHMKRSPVCMWDSYIKNTQKTYALSSTPAPIRANNSPFLPPMGRVQICAAYHRKHKGLSGRTASMESNEFC